MISRIFLSVFLLSTVFIADISPASADVLADIDAQALAEMEKESSWEGYLKDYSWPVMSFALGLIDGFNPCAMWSLVILISFLLTMENKTRRWIIGGIFLASSGILYGGALLTYLFGFQGIVALLSGGIMTMLLQLVGVMAIISAFFSFYAYYQNKVECEIRDAGARQKFHAKLGKLMQTENLLVVLPGVILLAFSVNAIELLCSVAIPTAFTATLISMEYPLAIQLTAIGIYDIAYMLDDVIVFTIAMFTLSYTSFSPKLVRASHLIGGVILLILGALLVFNVGFLTTLFA